jgi:hypothetical protein
MNSSLLYLILFYYIIYFLVSPPQVSRTLLLLFFLAIQDSGVAWNTHPQHTFTHAWCLEPHHPTTFIASRVGGVAVVGTPGLPARHPIPSGSGPLSRPPTMREEATCPVFDELTHH